MERITPLPRASSPVVTTSRRPASAARRLVAAPRPDDAQRTVWPRRRSSAPSAAPISPGCSSPMTATAASGSLLRLELPLAAPLAGDVCVALEPVLDDRPLRCADLVETLHRPVVRSFLQ